MGPIKASIQFVNTKIAFFYSKFRIFVTSLQRGGSCTFKTSFLLPRIRQDLCQCNFLAWRKQEISLKVAMVLLAILSIIEKRFNELHTPMSKLVSWDDICLED